LLLHFGQHTWYNFAMRTRLLSGGTWVCGKTIVPEGLTGPQLSFNFTVRKSKKGVLDMNFNEKLISLRKSKGRAAK